MRVAGAEKPQRIQKYVRISSTADAQNGKRSYFETASSFIADRAAQAAVLSAVCATVGYAGGGYNFGPAAACGKQIR